MRLSIKTTLQCKISTQIFWISSLVTLILKVPWLVNQFVRPGNLTLTLDVAKKIISAGANFHISGQKARKDFFELHTKDP